MHVWEDSDVDAHTWTRACVYVCEKVYLRARLWNPRADQLCKVTPPTPSQSGAGSGHKGESVSASGNAGGKSQHLNPQSAAVVCMCVRRSHGRVFVWTWPGELGGGGEAAS